MLLLKYQKEILKTFVSNFQDDDDFFNTWSSRREHAYNQMRLLFNIKEAEQIKPIPLLYDTLAEINDIVNPYRVIDLITYIRKIYERVFDVPVVNISYLFQIIEAFIPNIVGITNYVANTISI